MSPPSSSSSEPRRPRSAYNLFFRDEQAKLRQTRQPRSRNSGTDDRAESSVRVVARMWNNADASVREHYAELAKQDKNRYALEVVRWKQEQERQQNDQDEKDADVLQPSGMDKHRNTI